MSVTTKRLVIWALLALPIAVLIAFAFRPRPIPADLATVGRGPLTVTVSEEGETQIRDVYEVAAPLGGRLLRIDLEAGDLVAAGTTLIAELQPIDPSFLDLRTIAELRSAVQAAEAALALAEANVERAKARVAFDETDLARVIRLADRDTVSERRLDEAKLSLRTARAELAQARATRDMRTHELARTRSQLITPADTLGQRGECPCVPVLAPVDGEILRVLEESETVVEPGTVLAEIGDPRDLEIVADFLSADAVRIDPGHKVLIKDWGGDAVLTGEVTRIEPYAFTKVSALGIEEQRVNVHVDFTDPPEAYERLAHGFRVEAAVVLWEADDVLKVPLTALFRRGSEWALFAVEDGIARERLVGVGRSNGLETEIVSGLGVGDTIVLHPGGRIEDGAAVTQREAGT